MPQRCIEHVIFDADGVIQDIPGGWYEAMRPYLGDRARDFLHLTWKEERPTLEGKGDYLPLLARRLADWGVTAPVADVVRDVWHRIAVDDASLALATAVREAGYRTHLATNQEAIRGEYMKTSLGYAEHFDRCFYSYEVGYAKPDPRFFSAVTENLDTDPGSMLFIDDSAGNVDGAREAGLHTIHWHLSEGHTLLRARLAKHGVHV